MHYSGASWFTLANTRPSEMHKSLTAMHESSVRLSVCRYLLRLRRQALSAPFPQHLGAHLLPRRQNRVHRRRRIEHQSAWNGAAYSSWHGPCEDWAHTGYSQIFIRIAAHRDQPWPRVCYDDTDGSWEALCRTIEHEWRNESQYRPEMLNLLAHQLDLGCATRRWTI